MTISGQKKAVLLVKNFKVRTDLSFVTRSSQSFDKEYKIIVVDSKISMSDIPKFNTIPERNKGVIVFSIKCSQ